MWTFYWTKQLHRMVGSSLSRKHDNFSHDVLIARYNVYFYKPAHGLNSWMGELHSRYAFEVGAYLQSL